MTTERPITSGPLQKNLDNNINFSPNGRFLVFDCRDKGGINTNRHLGIVEVATGKTEIFYTQKPPALGVGAASFLNETSVVAIHALLSGLTYDFTVRGGMIIPTDGSGAIRWLDSRNVLPPFTPGALRGGTHKHEPDASGVWIGFTYNDHIMRARGSDLRQVGVSRRGTTVSVPEDRANFAGESFTVLLTECVDNPKPGSDQYRRAEGDCWVGRHGYAGPHGPIRARAFRGTVLVAEGDATAAYSDVFVVDVPDDITVAGPSGPLEGTERTYPSPPRGARVRRLTRTADHPDKEMRGVSGHLRADGSGRWVAFIGKARLKGEVSAQVFVVSPASGEIRRLSDLPGGVAGDPRFSPNGAFVAVGTPDGSVYAVDATERGWGRAMRVARPNPAPAHNIVIAPDSALIAYNRTLEGVQQVFICDAP
jgi:dipeptidyl aminopeptidase/acylaminoacyl peptidase